MEQHRTILQIMPAGGWYARYACERGHLETPLVAWALVEDQDGWRTLQGIDTGDGLTEFCEDSSNFQGYIHASERKEPYAGD